MLFSGLCKIMMNEVTFVVFRGSIAPPHWIRPWLHTLHSAGNLLPLRSYHFNPSFSFPVANKWIHERDQELRRTCGLKPNADNRIF